MTTQRDTWELMQTWQYVLPPSRPDVQDLEVIRQQLAQVERSSQVGVLGSTPEFRDLLHELGFETVVVLERSANFLQAMSMLRVHANDELIMMGDWLETLPECENRFTVLLSDLTAGNIRYEDRRIFYDLVTQALKPRGVFIDKNLTNQAGLLTVQEIRSKYAAMPINLQTVNYFSCEAIFCSDLQREEEHIDTSVIYDRLGLELTGTRFERLLRDCQLVTPRNCLWYYGKAWTELERDYCRSLNLVSRQDLNEAQPYYRRAHQYVFERR
jgi:hypothetical protein